MSDKQRVLVVDDDDSIAELITLYLNKECFETEVASDGPEALKKFESFAPELVLLDIMLPGIDGYEVLRQIRKSSKTPVIMLSAKGEVFDKVLGLELGADDYMGKPFDPKELLARVKAVLRRSAAGDAETREKPKPVGDIAEFPGLTINKTNYTVTYQGNRVEMPPKELELLYYLAVNPNRVFTREQLLDKIWGYDYVGDTRTVDVHVKRVREKIKDGETWRLSTVWGVGYKFEVD